LGFCHSLQNGTLALASCRCRTDRSADDEEGSDTMNAGRRRTGRVILALDQGTSSSRTLVVDEAGAILATAQVQLTRSFPQPGWVEQDGAAMWRAQLASARDAMAMADVSPAEVAGLGITNQRETTIVWDRATGEPVAPAIVWQDRRTAQACERLRAEGCEAMIKRRTGLLLDPYFSATKIAWLLDHTPQGRRRAAAGELAFGTVETWLAWQLSGGRLHISDATNACRTLLYNIHTGAWDDELLALFDVPREVLPEVCDTSGSLGEIDAHHLQASLPLTALVGDQQSALYGQACTTPGMAKATYGTGCFLLLHTGDTPAVSQHGLLTTVALQRDGRREYALEGSVFMAGAAMQWLRDGLELFADVADSGPLAARVPDSAGVYFVPALAGLGAPHWDAHARGALLGLTAGTTKAHIARAALEGLALQVGDLFRAVVEDAGLQPSELRVDGGAAANDLLLQIQATVLGATVARAAQKEATALGAAALAGLGAGLWDGVPPMLANWAADRRFWPDPAADREALLAGWDAAVASVRAFGSQVS
jgi:glycerol kinase